VTECGALDKHPVVCYNKLLKFGSGIFGENPRISLQNEFFKNFKNRRKK
jgi:hypothetical protein